MNAQPGATFHPAAGANPAVFLPRQAGIGLKPQHVTELLASRPALGFVEIHAENYLLAGGPFHQQLAQIRALYPLSVHGVSLSLGGSQAPDRAHLQAVAALLARYEAAQFSEHLAWSGHAGTYLNDLLPIPYSQQSLQRVCEHVDAVQSQLGRRILLENPATYLEFAGQSLSEGEFISSVIQRTGCGLLLDINNAYVSCTNHGRNVQHYLQSLPLWATSEIHLAGHAPYHDSLGFPLLIDSHDRLVAQEVWALYRQLCAHLGPLPTLIEWDARIPPLAVLLQEATLAGQLQSQTQEPCHVLDP